METTPGSVAKIILAGLIAAGARVVAERADDIGRNGFVRVEMPDKTIVTIDIEID